MRKVTRRKLCAMLIAVVMMLQVALPMAVSAQPPIPPAPHFGITITEVPNANPNQISVIVEQSTLMPLTWLISLIDIYYDDTRLQFAGFEIVTGMDELVAADARTVLVGANPDYGHARLMRFHMMLGTTLASAQTLLHFDILPGAPAGIAEIRWIPNSAATTTAAAGGPGNSTELFFRDPVPSDFANILIGSAQPSIPPAPHFGITITEVPNANPNQVSVIVDQSTLMPLTWLISLIEIYYDDTRLQFAGFEIVTGMEEWVAADARTVLFGANPDYGHARLMRFQMMLGTTLASAQTLLHFDILPDAPAGIAEIRWAPNSAATTTAAAGGPGNSTELFFRDPVPSDFANILID